MAAFYHGERDTHTHTKFLQTFVGLNKNPFGDENITPFCFCFSEFINRSAWEIVSEMEDQISWEMLLHFTWKCLRKWFQRVVDQSAWEMVLQFACNKEKTHVAKSEIMHGLNAKTILFFPVIWKKFLVHSLKYIDRKFWVLWLRERERGFNGEKNVVCTKRVIACWRASCNANLYITCAWVQSTWC
jgi:hypothetical protein